MTMPDYYYILMSQRDITQSQVLEEILRERANYYFSKNKPLDFWLTISPSFIKDLGINKKVIKTNFYNQHQPDIHVYPDMAFYGCLISLDKEFINWIKLRLGYFEDISLESPISLDSTLVSDGVYGKLNVSKDAISPLDSNSNLIDPSLILEKYNKILNISYSKFY
jgi:hypothetical protein